METKKNTGVIRWFTILVFFYLMIGAHAWFIWPLEDIENERITFLTMFFGAVLSLMYLNSRKLKLTMNSNIVTGLALLYVAFLLRSTISLITLINGVFFILPLWVLLSDTKDYDRIIGYIIKWLSIIVAIGSVIHVYFMIRGIMPGFPITHQGSDTYIFFNYFFLLEKWSYYDEYLRFQSIFLEPSFFGTLVAFLLYTIKFDFKKYRYSWVLLIGLFLSLSLAAFFLALFGYIACRYSQGRRVKTLLTIGVLLLTVFYVSKIYNDGNNMLNERVIERLEYDAEKGIRGNNRFEGSTDFYFEKSFGDGTFLFGLGGAEIEKINGGAGWQYDADHRYQIRGAGYKIFILYYGLISALMYFMAYYYIGVRKSHTKKYAVGFLVLIVATFMQASYPASYAWLIPFILAVKDRIR